MNQTHVLTSAQSEICQIDSPMRQRLPLPAVRQDTLHVVCVCVNRIGTLLSFPIREFFRGGRSEISGSSRWFQASDKNEYTMGDEDRRVPKRVMSGRLGGVGMARRLLYM